VSTPEQCAAAAARRLVGDLPSWLLLVLFALLALLFALAGTLDDWIRALLAVVFLAIGLTLFARLRGDSRAEPEQGGSVLRPSVYRPPDPAPPDEGV
jgi:hypothetical protein